MRTEGQAELAFTNWGGVRRGAGRKPSGARRRVDHVPRAAFTAREPLHATLRFVEGLENLRRGTPHETIVDALVTGTKPDFRVVHYALLPNHLHLLCEAHDEPALARGMQGLCVRIARRLNQEWLRRGRVFDGRYHVRALRSPREVRGALAYVLGNAEHHGLGTECGLDARSSARWFDGWNTRPRGSARHSPLPEAQTWLLCTGWRAAGLLDPLALCASSARKPAPKAARRADRDAGRQAALAPETLRNQVAAISPRPCGRETRSAPGNTPARVRRASPRRAPPLPPPRRPRPRT